MKGPSDRIGPYQIDRELASGGQATVYLAQDTRLGRSVALKVLARQAGVSRQRFQREAETAARLEDPGICTVHDVGVVGGALYIAMHYVEGRTLAQTLDESERPESHDDLMRAVSLIERVARSVHKAHEAGIVHRDLTPRNIMVTPEGEPVILDFGLAHDEESPVSLSLSGDLLGTPVYMSPEQIRAEPGGIDRRSDVYALGATLYECVTGRRPFQAPTREGLYRTILTQEPPDPRRFNAAIDRDLGVVIGKALAKENDRRYSTALDLAEDLRRVRAHEPIRARPAGAMLRLRRWGRRNPRLAAALALLALALTAALAGTTWLLAQRQVALAESIRRYDMRSAPALLEAETEGDWPATPDGIPDMDAWLTEAVALHGRLETHRAHLAALQENPSPEDDAAARERDDVAALVGDVEGLGAMIADVRARRADASTIRARTIDAWSDLWQETAQAIADRQRNPQYGGLTIEPQVGLVPLGQDPDSRLFEFAHLQSGEIAARDPESGELGLTEDTGFVLVLIPGGSFDMGADPPSEQRPQGSPNVDPHAGPWAQPVHRVTLDAFFLSKYEVSQAQWLRLTGSMGSFMTPTYYPQFAPVYSVLNPADSLDWDWCRHVLGRLGLAIPTEAQWEYAARAGTSTIWWTGDDARALEGAAQVVLPWGDPYEIGGFRSVASGRANPFGLLGLHGNAREWTGDFFGSYELPVRPGDGRGTAEPGETRVVRDGGGWQYLQGNTSASRSEILHHWKHAGLRPARRVSPSSY